MAVQGINGGKTNEESLQSEAEFIAKEVAYAVDDIQISRALPGDNNLVYFNLTTKEKQTICVELTTQGFRIVSSEYDRVDKRSGGENKHFESIYSLLDTISPAYRECFGNSLISKLQNLQKENGELS